MTCPIRTLTLLSSALLASLACAQNGPNLPTQLTIYNDDFAVARTSLDLNLKAGINDVLTTQVTRQMEPDSVVLRDPTGRSVFRIGEQNYDSNVINQNVMLKKFEGQTIDFQVIRSFGGEPQIVKGRIVRAGDNGAQPLVEVDGHLQFQLPGTPLFPASVDGLLLKPTLRWRIDAPKAEHFAAEFAYITRGLSWQATYNVIAPEAASVVEAEKADLVGWVTINNRSGTDFPQARVKLMAGDVAKLQVSASGMMVDVSPLQAQRSFSSAADVTQKAFDDFHLYDLNRTVALNDGEIKQVEFLTVDGFTMKRRYQYDGSATNLQTYYNNGYGNTQDSYGLSENTAVAVREEIKNSAANHLGMPLPSGRMRLYRRDSDGQMEFIGETMIRHTPVDETVKLAIGNAFDIKGKRTQTKFYTQNNPRFIDENFSIKLTNAKKQAVTVYVVEHLYRASNWVIRDPSVPYTGVDSHTIEFPVEVPASGETTVTYSVHYTW